MTIQPLLVQVWYSSPFNIFCRVYIYIHILDNVDYSNTPNLHKGFRREADSRYAAFSFSPHLFLTYSNSHCCSTKSFALYGTNSPEAQKIQSLETSLDTMFDNQCESKAPILWPAEPLKNWWLYSKKVNVCICTAFSMCFSLLHSNLQ